MSREFFDRSRYGRYSAPEEADKIKNLTGLSGSKADDMAAMDLLEEEKSRGKGWDFLREDIITILPAPEGSDTKKRVKIVLKTYDKKMYKVFNCAAEEVAQRYQGFHESGYDVDRGISSWEMMDLKGDSPSEIVDKIYRKMRKLEKID